MPPIDRIDLQQGNITQLQVDAIVNAANSSLLGGGGGDGAIHRAAGPDLLAECRTLNGCPTGQARITAAYRLPAKHVIHTVGPVYHNAPQDAQLLADCYRNSLQLAVEHNILSIAFPAISCGIYGYPIQDAYRIALQTTLDFLSAHPTPQRIISSSSFPRPTTRSTGNSCPTSGVGRSDLDRWSKTHFGRYITVSEGRSRLHFHHLPLTKEAGMKNADYLDISTQEREKIFFFMFNSFLCARIDTENETEDDEDVNMYMAQLLQSAVDGRFYVDHAEVLAGDPVDVYEKGENKMATATSWRSTAATPTTA